MQEAYSLPGQTPTISRMRRQIESSGDVLDKLVDHVQLTIKGLRSGDLHASEQTFGKVTEELKEFLSVLARAESYGGKMTIILKVFQARLTEYFHRLEGLQRDGELGVFLDVLQYEVVPLLAGWDGVKSGLMDYLDDVG